MRAGTRCTARRGQPGAPTQANEGQRGAAGPPAAPQEPEVYPGAGANRAYEVSKFEKKLKEAEASRENRTAGCGEAALPGQIAPF